MNIQISATAIVILGVSALAGLLVYRWSQARTPLGCPTAIGDLGAAIITAVGVGGLLVALGALPPDDGCTKNRSFSVTTKQCPSPDEGTPTPSPSGTR